MKRVGIIGGIAPESTVDYYRQIIAGYRKRSTGSSCAPVIINSIDMVRMLGMVSASRLDELVGFLQEEIERLARAGADFAVLSSNTPHIAFDEIRRRSPIPMISIVESTAAVAASRGFKRVGLFGTRFTMKAGFYADVFAKSGPAEREYAAARTGLMKSIAIATFVFAASMQAASSPLGKVSGSCTFDKTRTVKFVDGVALPGKSFLDDKQSVTLVRLSTAALSALHPDLFVDPSTALDGMKGIITIEIDNAGKLNGLGPSGSFRTGFTFSGGAVKNGRASGTVSGTGGARDDDKCAITFDVPVVGDYGAGKALPAGGGDPGKAMQSLWTSLKNEDSAATIAVLGESLVPPAQKGTMPQFVTLFGSGSGNRITGGKLYGAGRAILDLEFPGEMKGRALVLKQGDRWRIQDVSFD